MKVAVVTGTRAEYGIWRPVLRAIAATPKLQLQLVATGMHLLREFGWTIRQIERDGWTVAARVPMYQGVESLGRSLARGTAGLDRAFDRLDPDVVMVLGDRLEILAAAQAAMCQRRLIAHVHGGETAPGQMDEQIRHAVTKLAHLHFCSTAVARRRILRMGEEPSRVFQVGAPALAEVAAFRAAHPGLAPGKRPLLALHPSSADDEYEYQRTRLVVETLLPFCGETLEVIGPNNDPGHRGILRAYETWGPRVTLTMSLPQEAFWEKAVRQGVLVGNSSSGIIEMASLGVPVVNIGPRQAGRQRSVNVVDVDFAATAIRRALRRVLSDQAFRRRVARRKNVYGDGGAAERIAAILGDADVRALARPKPFQDGL